MNIQRLYYNHSGILHASPVIIIRAVCVKLIIVVILQLQYILLYYFSFYSIIKTNCIWLIRKQNFVGFQLLIGLQDVVFLANLFLKVPCLSLNVVDFDTVPREDKLAFQGNISWQMYCRSLEQVPGLLKQFAPVNAGC